VVPFAPHALPGAQRFLYMSAYFLPVAVRSSVVWFRVHVYYDIVSSFEYILLSYGDGADSAPVVRVHSDSLFDRFPLRAARNREKLRRALAHIVDNGHGFLLLLYSDGRGAGFGARACDRMLTSSGRADCSEAAYRELAIKFDSRDYDACVALLARHVRGKRVQMVVQSAESLVRKHALMRSLRDNGMEVCKWIGMEGGAHTAETRVGGSLTRAV
jgi:3,4-dihydroxy 2-butanone 4-phosphate synthase/GTP cyclohydrolase II